MDRRIFSRADPAAYRSVAFRETAGRLVRPVVRAAFAQSIGRRFGYLCHGELELLVDGAVGEIFKKLNVERLAAKPTSESRLEMFMTFSLLHARTCAIELLRRTPLGRSSDGIATSNAADDDAEIMRLRLTEGKSWREIEEHFHHIYSRTYLRVRLAKLAAMLRTAARARE